jgi:pyruvate,orthophosphate dikinase
MTAQWTVRLDGSTLPDKALIGGKAWSIARMRGLDLLVPPAFVITTQACNAYLAEGAFPEGLEAEIEAGLAWLDEATGRRFGGAERPLLLSVRSGAAISMPGMMDTVLNLGIDDAAEGALAAESGLPDFARDTHRRFLELYASIVLKSPVELAHDGSPADWCAQVAVPATPRECLDGAVRAVFDSWNTRRAKKYREHNNIPHDMGTAVTIQAMVFGNLDDHSGTGVLFSRNPLTGDPAPYGEYLPRAQGEDVVSGKFTPLGLDAMHDLDPASHAALLAASARLEREHRDMQDIEFTVQSGTLYLLQSRSAKRAPDAAVRAAVDMVGEGLIDIDQALSRVSPEQVRALLLPRLGAGADGASIVAQGEGACPGVACGTVVTDPDEAERRAATGEAIILVRATTSPDDIHGMIAARAVVTEQGGSTSHAAVVSRALGRPCVVGVGAGPKAGDIVTVDGESGRVYAGELPVEMPDEAADARLAQLIDWARERSPVRVLRPADAAGIEGAVDIDAQWSGGEPEALPALLHGAAAAKGSALANPETARLARAQGVRTIVTEPVLPALLAMLGEAA